MSSIFDHRFFFWQVVTIERAVQSVKHFLTSKKTTCGLNIDTQIHVKYKGIRILWNSFFFLDSSPLCAFIIAVLIYIDILMC